MLARQNNVDHIKQRNRMTKKHETARYNTSRNTVLQQSSFSLSSYIFIKFTMSTLSDSKLEKGIRAILSSPSFDLNSETFKTIRAKLCKRLRLDRLPANKKGTFKDILTRIINEEEEESEDDSEIGESSEEEKEVKPKAASTKGKTKKKQTTKRKSSKPAASSYSSNVNSLLDLGKAMRMGPSLYKGLKEMDDEEQISTITERLLASGASWTGKIPTSKDVQKAKAKRQREDDLDGMDTSLIIEGGRRRRTGAVNYADNNPLHNDDEEDVEFEEDECDRPPKRGKSEKIAASSDEEDNEDDEDFDDDETSEEEFD